MHEIPGERGPRRGRAEAAGPEAAVGHDAARVHPPQDTTPPAVPAGGRNGGPGASGGVDHGRARGSGPAPDQGPARDAGPDGRAGSGASTERNVGSGSGLNADPGTERNVDAGPAGRAGSGAGRIVNPGAGRDVGSAADRSADPGVGRGVGTRAGRNVGPRAPGSGSGVRRAPWVRRGRAAPRPPRGAAGWGLGAPWGKGGGDESFAGRLPWRSSLAVGVVQFVGTQFAARNQPAHTDLAPFGYVLLFAGPALLLLRHRHPRLAVFGTSAVTAGYLGAGYPYGPVFISVVIACVAAVVAGQRIAAWSALGALWLSHLLIGHWLYRWLPPTGDGPVAWGQELGVAAWAVAVVAASELVRVRREQWARERAEREAAARRRADEERLRIARELHDVLAHSISVINVQAGVGLALLDQDPEQARTALTTIKSASKEALGEVRQVLDTLRASGAAPRSPAPGLDRLAELSEQAAGAGLTVGVEVEGVRTALPPGTDLAAFRIVQEALTNIVRHSGARTARVLLRYAPDELELRVDDDGPATKDGMTGGGNGLVGMRERAAALGGTVQAGPRPDGGFRVLARIPLGGGAAGADTDTVAASEEEAP